VHVAESHGREWPEEVHAAAASEIHPDKRVIAMLGVRGKTVAKTAAPKTKTQASA
jgi:hypothetical protein